MFVIKFFVFNGSVWLWKFSNWKIQFGLRIVLKWNQTEPITPLILFLCCKYMILYIVMNYFQGIMEPLMDRVKFGGISSTMMNWITQEGTLLRSFTRITSSFPTLRSSTLRRGTSIRYTAGKDQFHIENWFADCFCIFISCIRCWL